MTRYRPLVLPEGACGEPGPWVEAGPSGPSRPPGVAVLTTPGLLESLGPLAWEVETDGLVLDGGTLVVFLRARVRRRTLLDAARARRFAVERAAEALPFVRSERRALLEDALAVALAHADGSADDDALRATWPLLDPLHTGRLPIEPFAWEPEDAGACAAASCAVSAVRAAVGDSFGVAGAPRSVGAAARWSAQAAAAAADWLDPGRTAGPAVLRATSGRHVRLLEALLDEAV